jgi:hypothetical protein
MRLLLWCPNLSSSTPHAKAENKERQSDWGSFCERTAHSRGLDDVDPKSRRIDGVKYVDTEQWQAMKEILALVNEALAQAGKK